MATEPVDEIGAMKQAPPIDSAPTEAPETAEEETAPNTRSRRANDVENAEAPAPGTAVEGKEESALAKNDSDLSMRDRQADTSENAEAPAPDTAVEGYEESESSKEDATQDMRGRQADNSERADASGQDALSEGTIGVATSVAAPATLRWRERTFTLKDGAWRERGFDGEARTRITIPSAAWNALLDEHPDLNKLITQKEPVIVRLDQRWYELHHTTPAPPNNRE